MGSKIWKAAEIERLTSKERAELAKATVVYDIADAPDHILKSARESVERHLAHLETGAEGPKGWPAERIIALEPEQFATLMGFIRTTDYDAIDRMIQDEPSSTRETD